MDPSSPFTPDEDARGILAAIVDSSDDALNTTVTLNLPVQATG